MTVIAWDGKQLAADRRTSSGSLVRISTKIFRLGEALAGYSGDADAGEEIVAWFRDGHHPEKFPSSLRKDEGWGRLLIVWPDGILWMYGRTPHPVKFPPQQFAIGSGRDFAHAAMYCGKNAPEAVEVACVFDSGCGNGVDVLTHSAVAELA